MYLLKFVLLLFTGYVTELFLTLEAVVDSLDSDFRPMTRDIFKSTPNLKEQSTISGPTRGSEDPRKTSPRHVTETDRAPRPQSPAGLRTGHGAVISPVPGHVYHASAPPMNPIGRYERSHHHKPATIPANHPSDDDGKPLECSLTHHQEFIHSFHGPNGVLTLLAYEQCRKVV